MDWDSIIVIICLSAILALALTIIIFSLIKKRRIKIVEKNSIRLQRLKSLNIQTEFIKLNTRSDINEYCNSKRNLDYLNFDELVKTKLSYRLNYYEELFQQIELNRISCKQYNEKYNELCSLATAEDTKKWRISYKAFIKTEEVLCLQNKLNIPCNFNLHVYANYTSPKGRNSYTRERNYSAEVLKILLQRVQQEEKQKATRQYQIKVERTKMSPSLRYDVFCRDHFRCKICGACADDGVTLHVDHIIPVSKGGRTIISNLQTLCERCNLGKGNKI